MPADPSTERFEQRIEILPEDIDAFEHVNNVVYLRWVQDVSVAHWLAAATEDQKEQYGWLVARHEIDYLNPARLSDELIAATWVGTAKKHLFERHVEIVRVSDHKVMARARTLWAAINLKTRRLTRVGPDVYERFSVTDGNAAAAA